jgi:outer membrane receptor protein involved in Fe transport
MRARYGAASVAALMLAFVCGPLRAADVAPAPAAQSTVEQTTLKGRVLDQRGSGLGAAVVSVTGAGKTLTTRTAADGSFSIAVAPGVYSVVVNKGGFQGAQNDNVVVAPGSTLDLTIALNETNLSSLRVIGRSSTSYNRAPFNISESAVSSLPAQLITQRQNPNLTDTVATVPGVIAERTFSSTPNTNFAVRGSPLQTRVTIDGHPISSGISGQWNTNYAVASIFQNVEVVKGTGLNGAIAGESAVGTVNLRTRDFTPGNSAGLIFGEDEFDGSQYNAFADVNFLNNKASLIVQKAFSGYRGPWDNYYGDRIGATSPIPIGTGLVPNLTGLDQWQGDYSNRYSLQGELVKGRYRFNDTSSLTLEFLGLQGQYSPQGGSYGTFDGVTTLQACENGTKFQATLATCTGSSLYGAPYTFGAIGQKVNAYTWFPRSFIQNNEPQFSAEFRTSFKNDSISFRPYTHLINRFISGVNENTYPGNGGGWYAVTSAANCQVQFIAPGTKGAGAPGSGAAGPCFPVTMGPTAPAYIGANAAGLTPVFATTSAAPVCSPTPPYSCFTTPTGIQNNGLYGYSTPFSQPEIDRLNGYTFSYLHPVGDNAYNFTYDYRKDYSQSQSTDQTGAAPGCSFVIGSVSGSSVFQTLGPGAGTLFQPGCSTTQYPATGSALTTYNKLPRSAIGTPPTVSQYLDFALTGRFALTPRLTLALGNYVEIYQLAAQVEDPAVLAAYAAKGNSAAAPVSLVNRSSTYDHYDPHAGVQYRVTPTLSVRANAGSSITQPYPALVSGFGSISIPNAANPNYTVAIPNFNLKPETTVAYDVGFDQRFAGDNVLALDAYHLNVHNVFLSQTQAIPAVPNVPGVIPGVTQYLQTNFVNGPEQRSYGLEVAMYKSPPVGLGYYTSLTLNRTYYAQLPLSLYSGNTSPGNVNYNINDAQIFGNPFVKGYGQVFFNTPKGVSLEFGADWEGQDNATFGPPYIITDTSVRVPLGSRRAHLQLSVQNLTNYNPGTALGRTLAAQGNIEPGVYLSKGALLFAGPGASTSTPLQALPPRTARLLLDLAL